MCLRLAGVATGLLYFADRTGDDAVFCALARIPGVCLLFFPEMSPWSDVVCWSKC